ncbi:MAG: DNA translocase FtsK [Clostridia bacterium]|nr:DNA translocase FtsK [Clostridia bacterium]
MGVNSFHWCGGIIGAVVGGLLLEGCGKAGAFVIVGALLIVSILVCFGIGLNSVGNVVSTFINKSKDKIDETNENTKIRLDEKKRLREEKKKLEEEQRALESEENIDENEESEEYFAEEQLETDSNSAVGIFDFNETEIENDPLKNKEEPVKPAAPFKSKQSNTPISNQTYKRTLKPYRPDENVFTYPDKNASVSTSRSETNIRFSGDDLISAGAKRTEDAFGNAYKTNKEEEVLPVDYEEIKENIEEGIFIDVDDEFADRREELSTKAKKIVNDAADSAAAVRKKNMDEVNNFVEEKKTKREYTLPSIDCLNEPKFGSEENYAEEMKMTARKLVDVLKSFGVETKLIGVSRGPSVTRYELSPAPGVKISKITNLADDIALGLASSGVRIEAPIPNKSAVGIEVPNKSRATVTMREMVSSEEYNKGKNSGKLLNVALGKDITGNITCADLSKMPHLLIAGTTGSGKSVCLNVMIASILYNATPSQVKLLMIDPKQVEFTVYNGIPHLLVPVISDARKAAGSLAWAVGEMDSRYKTFSSCAVRDIASYNKYAEEHPELNLQYMPQIVIFIDELNDLMMVSPKEVEDSICRLAQKARAAGMHLVVATQRPSVDVITGIIKANIPSRISLSVSSQVDSRTILDAIGAEKLLGNGDMLFNPVGMSKPVRIQGAYLSDTEIEKIVTFIKNQENAEYDDGIMEEIEKNAVVDTKKKSSSSVAGDDADNQYDVLIEDAMNIVTELNSASTTVIQRKLSVGYARAARIMDQLEQLGYISPAEGNKPRRVLVSRAQYLEMRAGADNVGNDDFDVLSD